MNNLQANLNDIFICPISLERMNNPIINSCGHTYEKVQIDGWIAAEQLRIRPGQVVGCPLCREPITNLVPNMLVAQALEVLDAPANNLANRTTNLADLSDLSDEEREQVEAAIEAIKNRREEDLSNGVPDRLPEPKKFMKRVAEAISDVYYCK